MDLLMDPERIRFACDPYDNPMWKAASQLSRGVDGLLLSDAFADADAVDEWANKLTRLLRGGLTPEQVALRLTMVPKRERWKASTLQSKQTRTIAVRSILGRCVSNHLAGVLQMTGEAVLPPSALAYRPGNRDVIQEALLDVASAVGLAGYRFWAKLDVKDCFNALPRPAVARAMRRLGYPQAFIRLVMMSVGAPRYRRVRGHLLLQDSSLGCPAGLPESSVLVNLLFASLDRQVEQRFPGVVYRRYCDDFILLGRSRTEVERAVVHLRRWMDSVPLQLKGVSPRQSSRTLVQDVREHPLVFLGASIDHEGRIRIPSEVLDGQFSKIRYLLDEAARHSELVCARSRYDETGRRTAGVATFDLEDVCASVNGFHRYWSELDQGEAKIFLGRATVEFPINPTAGTGPFRKLWAATLGRPENLIGGGHVADQANTAEPLEAWFRAEVLPILRGALQGDKCTGAGPDGMEDLELAGTSDWDDGKPHAATHHPGRQTNEEYRTSWSTPAKGSPGDPKPVDVDEPVGSDANSACGLSAGSRGAATSRNASEHTAPGAALPPGAPRGSDLRLLLLHYEYDPITEATCIRSHERSAQRGHLGTWAMTFEGLPAELAVLEYLLVRLQQIGNERAVVAMHRSWLAKLLLQRGREPRSVALFQRLRQLHRVGQRAAVVAPVNLGAQSPTC